MARRVDTYSLQMEVQAAGLRRGLRAANQEISKSGQLLKDFKEGLTSFDDSSLVGDTLQTAGLGKFVKGAVTAYGELVNVQQTADQVFKDSASTIYEWAEDSVEAVGLSERAAIQSATNIAGLGKQIGLAGDELATFSQDIVGLGADLAAAFNTDVASAVGAIQSGFSGSSIEPLRRYNIVLNDTSLKQEYLRITGENVSQVLTQQQRAVAFLSLLYQRSADYIGQWDRESDQFLGTQQRLNAAWEDFQADAGRGLEPIATGLLNIGTQALGLAGSIDEATDGMSSMVLAGTAVAGAIYPGLRRVRAGMLGVASSANLSAAATTRLTAAAGLLMPAIGVLGAAFLAESYKQSVYAKNTREAVLAVNDLVSASAQLQSVEFGQTLGKQIEYMQQLDDMIGSGAGAGGIIGGIDTLVTSLKNLENPWGANDVPNENLIGWFEDIANQSGPAANALLNWFNTTEAGKKKAEELNIPLEDFQRILDDVVLATIAAEASGREWQQMLEDQAKAAGDNGEEIESVEERMKSYTESVTDNAQAIREAAIEQEKLSAKFSDAFTDIDTSRAEDLGKAFSDAFGAITEPQEIRLSMRTLREEIAQLADIEVPSFAATLDVSDEGAAEYLAMISSIGQQVAPVLARAMESGGTDAMLRTGGAWRQSIIDAMGEGASESDVQQVLEDLGLTEDQLQATATIAVEASVSDEARQLLDLALGQKLITTSEFLKLKAGIDVDPDATLDAVYAVLADRGVEVPGTLDVDWEEGVAQAEDLDVSINGELVMDAAAEQAKVQSSFTGRNVEIGAALSTSDLNAELDAIERQTRYVTVQARYSGSYYPSPPSGGGTTDREPYSVPVPAQGGQPITQTFNITQPVGTDSDVVVNSLQRWMRRNGQIGAFEV